MQELNESLALKCLRQEEYAKLVDDLLNLEQINKLQNIERKSHIEEAYVLLRKFVVDAA